MFLQKTIESVRKYTYKAPAFFIVYKAKQLCYTGEKSQFHNEVSEWKEKLTLSLYVTI